MSNSKHKKSSNASNASQAGQPRATPMTRDAVSRIVEAETRDHGGKILPGSFTSRSDAVVQRRDAKAPMVRPAKVPTAPAQAPGGKSAQSARGPAPGNRAKAGPPRAWPQTPGRTERLKSEQHKTDCSATRPAR
jgi:hypothetical protein